MSNRNAIIWITAVGTIGVGFGLFYGLFGLESLPIYQKIVQPNALNPWKDGLYGATFIGFSVLLLFVGRHAFTQGDKSLMKILLYGIGAWLLVEAIFSLYYGVYLNVAVDVVLMTCLGWPLIKGVRANS
jgi:hypothetical protein